MKSKLLIAFSLLILSIMVTPLITDSALAASKKSTSGACYGGSDLNFFNLPPWYRGVSEEVNGKCSVVFRGDGEDLGKFIYIIGINIIEVALKLVGYVAAGFIIYGGFLYMSSGGSTERARKGQVTLTNAAVGLAISLSSVAITNKLFEVAKGSHKNASAITILNNLLDIVYWVAGSVAVVTLIIAGIKMISSQGNPEKTATARRSITYSVVGLIVIIIAFTITNTIIGKLS